MIHFEELEVGATQAFGSRAVTREEVLAFARDYDPQPFHLSDEAAEATHFGRLSASGWQTCALVMRMMVDHFLGRIASLGAGGVDELRWERPVHPGDTLRVEATIVSKRRSRSNRGLGLFRSRVEAFNQHDRRVLHFIANGMVAVRDPAAPIDPA